MRRRVVRDLSPLDWARASVEAARKVPDVYVLTIERTSVGYWLDQLRRGNAWYRRMRRRTNRAERRSGP